MFQYTLVEVQGFKARRFRGILTLTLSRWEKEQLLDGFVKIVSELAESSRGECMSLLTSAATDYQVAAANRNELADFLTT